MTAGRHGVALGVDLGTTNSVVGYVPPGETVPRVFPIPQRVTRDTEEARALLPSFLYAPLAGELPGDPDFIVGAFAKARGAEIPARAVTSAKSWLCHAAVDRTAAILPFGLSDDLAALRDGTPHISPLDASRRILDHVHHAWSAAHPHLRLEDGLVALTVPASFDDDARELTRLAAFRAGLGGTLRLLEEPVAALYDFLARDEADVTLDGLGDDALVLVCDVGGGTTDLSLVRVGKSEDGRPSLARVASGRHLLLGGDNMDLALAHALEDRFVQRGDKLSPARFAELTASCRAAKEILFSGDVGEANVTLAGQGSKLVAGTRKAALPRALAEEIVISGFFPAVERGEVPRGTTAALRGLGLPYERDPAVTRHVSGFLSRHAGEGSVRAVLLNGGVFRSPALASALLGALGACFDSAPVLLPNPDPDLAVARGAATYARLLASGEGARIRGGSARSYFVGVGSTSSQKKAVCVIPRFAEEGARHTVHETFSLTLGTRARFSLLASDVDKSETGAIVSVDDTKHFPLPELVARLGAPGEKGAAQVTLEGELSQVGTLDLACVGADGRKFRLAFRLERGDDEGRSIVPAAPSMPPEALSVPPRSLERVHSALASERALSLAGAAFGKKAEPDPRAVKDLPRELEKVLGDKGTWPVETARALADVLLTNPGGRRRSLDHERVWFQLVGHALRPGRGAPGDAARVATFEKTWEGRLAFPDEPRGFSAFFVAFRRVSQGLSANVQESIAEYAASVLAPNEANLKRPKRMPDAQDELVLLAASLERVPPRVRAAFGEWLFDRVRAKDDARVWDALGKLGARVPSYGPLHEVLPVGPVEAWLERLVKTEWKKDPRTLARSAALLARRTGDRTRDVNERLRALTLEKLVASQAVPEEPWIRMVRELVLPDDHLTEAGLFDDDLPPGLTLTRDDE